MTKLEQFCTERGLSGNTSKVYLSSVKLYEELNEPLSFTELIAEADFEEEVGKLRWKHRKLKERLVKFREYLFANKSEGTAKKYLTCIKTIYKHFEIEIGTLPPFKSKQIDTTYKMDYEDLLTKSELIDAYYGANNLTKCIILFAISSGLSKVDMLNLTIEQFISACDIQLTHEDLLGQLFELKEQEEIIPCFRGGRQKTASKYITFCSPEAVNHIIQYLLDRDAEIKFKYEQSSESEKLHLQRELLPSDMLFDVTGEHLSYSFRKLNSKLNLGKVGKFTKLRCHMLRKFHASTLLNSEILTWTVDEIDTLQGRSMDMTHQAYFKNSREKLFKKYYACVDELMLFQSIHGIDEEEYHKLETENRFYKNEIVKNEQKMEEQQKTINKIIENQKELEKLLGMG